MYLRQEYHKKDAVLFSEHYIRRHMTSICPVTGKHTGIFTKDLESYMRRKTARAWNSAPHNECFNYSDQRASQAEARPGL